MPSPSPMNSTPARSRMHLVCPLGLALALVFNGACGARTVTPGESDSGGVPQADALFVAGESCPEEASASGAEELLATEVSGESVVVVEVFYASECTGLGGQYVLARSLDDARSFWLGGHGCQFFDDALVGAPAVFGVLRASQTAALFQIEPGICVGFPGQSDGVASDSKVLAVALFETEEDARQFAAAIEE